MATLRHVGPGIKNLVNNTIAVPARFIDTYRPVDAGMTVKQVQRENVRVIKKLEDVKSQIAELEAKVQLHPEDLDLAGQRQHSKVIRRRTPCSL